MERCCKNRRTPKRSSRALICCFTSPQWISVCVFASDGPEERERKSDCRFVCLLLSNSPCRFYWIFLYHHVSQHIHATVCESENTPKESDELGAADAAAHRATRTEQPDAGWTGVPWVFFFLFFCQFVCYKFSGVCIYVQLQTRFIAWNLWTL